MTEHRTITQLGNGLVDWFLDNNRSTWPERAAVGFIFIATLYAVMLLIATTIIMVVQISQHGITNETLFLILDYKPSNDLPNSYMMSVGFFYVAYGLFLLFQRTIATRGKEREAKIKAILNEKYGKIRMERIHVVDYQIPAVCDSCLHDLTDHMEERIGPCKKSGCDCGGFKPQRILEA